MNEHRGRANHTMWNVRRGVLALAALTSLLLPSPRIEAEEEQLAPCYCDEVTTIGENTQFTKHQFRANHGGCYKKSPGGYHTDEQSGYCWPHHDICTTLMDWACRPGPFE